MHKKLSLGRFSSIVDAVYASATGDTNWTVAIDGIARAVNSHIAVLWGRDAKSPVPDSFLVPGLEEGSLEELRKILSVEVHLLELFERQKVNSFFSTGDPGLCNFYYRSCVRNEFDLPRDIHHTISCQIPLIGSRSALIGFHRSDHYGPYSDVERELLGEILPHVQRALRVQARLDRADVSSRRYEDALGMLDIALMEVGTGARVIWLSQSMQALVRRGDILVQKGIVFVPRSEENTLLQRRIAQCCGGLPVGSVKDPANGPTVAISSRMSRVPLAVEIVPLVGPGLERRGRALLVISEPDVVRSLDSAWLYQAFAFTPMEAKVASSIVAGYSLDNTADSLGVKIGTIRNYTKRIYKKAGVRRQAELVWLLRRIGALRS